MYEKLKQAILDRMYTVTEAMNLLNAFLQTGQITAEQYKELFEIAEDDHQKEWQEYKEKVDKMWAKFTETGEEEPEEPEDPKPEEPDGSKDKPFPATNNMQYYNGKYYTYNGILYCLGYGIQIFFPYTDNYFWIRRIVQNDTKWIKIDGTPME